MQEEDGVVRVVFATMALGVGVNFVALNTIYHYGAPRTIDNFFQESGRAGRSGAQAKSVVYWKPSDAPLGGGAWVRGYPTLRQKKNTSTWCYSGQNFSVLCLYSYMYVAAPALKLAGISIKISTMSVNNAATIWIDC